MTNLIKPTRSRRRTKVTAEKLTLAHGAGGKAMRDLIDDVFTSVFGAEHAHPEDQFNFDLRELSDLGSQVAFTTDSFVIDPIFFPGGDIGSLAVNGTVNDLAVGGGIPLYLSCSVILEEGFAVSELRRIAASMATAAKTAGVRIVTGDTKVVERGAADKIFITTAGIGVVPHGVRLNAGGARAGDVVVVSGTIGDHGAAIVASRRDLAIEHSLESDCRALNSLTQAMLARCPEIRCMRDATRGGVAAVLNEIAEASGVTIRINETQLPIKNEVRGVCELLGLDALYLANEGKLVAIVPADAATTLVEEMNKHEAGRAARVIGKVTETSDGMLLLNTAFGGTRIVDLLVGDQLPRIC